MCQDRTLSFLVGFEITEVAFGVRGGSLLFPVETQDIERPYIFFHGHIELFQKKRFPVTYFTVFNYILV